MVVDDEESMRRQLREFLEGEKLDGEGEAPHVTTATFAEALAMLEDCRFDLLILDVIDAGGGTRDDTRGRKTLEEIQQRMFVPVIFFTALPKLVEDLGSQAVRVVEKTKSFDGLRKALVETLATGLPRLSRLLGSHFRAVERGYLWSYVAKHWDDFDKENRTASIGYALARRLAASMSIPAVQDLAGKLGDKEAEALKAGRVPPSRYYLVPPLEGGSAWAGDIFTGRVGEVDGSWVLLTPSCDLVQGNAEYVVLVPATPLVEFDAWKKWSAAKAKGKAKDERDDLERLMQNRKSERYFFLPKSTAFPHLVADLQRPHSVKCEDLLTLKRLASLDSPFAEALLSRFGRFSSRLGTPDLDVAPLLD